MSEVIAAFWTGTGNTAEMAEYAAEESKKAELRQSCFCEMISRQQDLKDAKAFALGCPSMELNS